MQLFIFVQIFIYVRQVRDNSGWEGSIAVVLDKEALLGRLIGGISNVLSKSSLSVRLAPLEEGNLGSGDVGLVTLPDLEHSGLESATIRERHGPGPGGVNLVDGIQVHGGLLLALTSRKEGDTGNGSGHSPLEGSHGRLGDFVGRVLLGALRARADHVGLKEGSLKIQSVQLAPGIGGDQDTLSGGDGSREIVVAIHEDLWLNDGHKAVNLGDHSHAGEGLCVGLDGESGGHSLSNAEGTAPLGEAGAGLEVVSALLVQVVKTLGDGLASGSGKGHQALQRRRGRKGRNERKEERFQDSIPTKKELTISLK